MLSRRRHNSTDEQDELVFLGMEPAVSRTTLPGCFCMSDQVRLLLSLPPPAA